MKKIKFGKKISLKKETIVKLSNEQLNVLRGGAPASTLTRTCPPTSSACGNNPSQTSNVC